ncbi:MAG: flagellar biosynthetic protein FliP [Hyphomicrobium sp.]|nr:MAG: flagellar biosynthetic protein FliP [Hyphomicrobium sp.]
MRWAPVLLLAAGTMAFSESASAQTIDLTNILDPKSGTTAGRIIQSILALTVLSLAPGILMMVTCFTRFIIAFSFLRAALGLQTTPSNLILINLALFMTWFVMAPTFDRAWQQGLKPLVANEITTEAAMPRIVEPFREFMKGNVREADLRQMQILAEERSLLPQGGSESDLSVLVPAFMLSELRRGFEIGFLIALPFLVIDMIVATIVMSMGMMMLSPVVFSLPLKVLFFVLVDGWSILVSGLVRSFA